MFKLVSLRASGFKRLDIDDQLHFPEGRLLVHGRNESGKSTLMEAIHYALYGMPLRPSKNAGNEDIIGYGRDKAVVELEFTIDDSQYLVRRELYRKKGNQHFLNKRDREGDLDRVTNGARAVNKALNEILHGIDSDALLNSCLVEQKELGKLENANKQERVRAMSSLLNLEAFVDAENALKRETRELKSDHNQTQNQLEIAELAKEAYESALNELESAENRVKEILNERREAEELHRKTELRLESAEKLSRLVGELKEAEAQQNTSNVRHEEGQRQLLEAEEAKGRIVDLDKSIVQYTPVEDAVEQIEAISGLVGKFSSHQDEEKRAENQMKETLERLKDVKASEHRIQALEEEEAGAVASRDRVNTGRTGGVAVAAAGVLLLLYWFISFSWLTIGLGLVSLAAGGYLFTSNDPDKYEEMITHARTKRDEMLGDRQRIQEFNETLTRLESELKELEDEKKDAEESLTKEISGLPSAPRDYGSVISLTDPSTLNQLRRMIQEDSNTLSGYSAERRSLQKKADSASEVRVSLKEIEKEREGLESKMGSLNGSVEAAEGESGIPRDLIEEIEKTLRSEKEGYVATLSRLDQEEIDKERIIGDAKRVIEEKAELKDNYPTLVEQVKEEKFRLDATGKAVTLLEMTRTSIVGGVKQNVEKNMMQFLPTLTDNRYSMARIDEENYRIEVYDKNAKRWRGKGVFSGATQDQFSLALRLAFAISTIPSSRGARPSFIFLDEPLSGFDAQRRIGFMQLLREALSRHFHQIIVISHIEALAEEFQDSLHIESGRIIEVQR